MSETTTPTAAAAPANSKHPDPLVAKLRAERRAAREDLEGLEGDLPKLQAVHDDHRIAAEQARKDFRAGKADLDAVRRAEGHAMAVKSLLEDHTRDIHAARERVAALHKDVEDAEARYRMRHNAERADLALRRYREEADALGEYILKKLNLLRAYEHAAKADLDRAHRIAAHFQTRDVDSSVQEGERKRAIREAMDRESLVHGHMPHTLPFGIPWQWQNLVNQVWYSKDPAARPKDVPEFEDAPDEDDAIDAEA